MSDRADQLLREIVETWNREYSARFVSAVRAAEHYLNEKPAPDRCERCGRIWSVPTLESRCVLCGLTLPHEPDDDFLSYVQRVGKVGETYQETNTGRTVSIGGGGGMASPSAAKKCDDAANVAAERRIKEIVAEAWQLRGMISPLDAAIRTAWTEATEAAAKKCEDEKVSAELRRFNANDLVHNTACDYCAAAIRGKGG